MRGEGREAPEAQYPGCFHIQAHDLGLDLGRVRQPEERRGRTALVDLEMKVVALTFFEKKI